MTVQVAPSRPETSTDPASDVRDEIATSSGVPELADKIWFHRTAAAVIDAGRCVGCGGCIAACPSRSIGLGEDGKPTLIRMCTGCSACWDHCPLGGLRVERLGRDLGSVASGVHPAESEDGTTPPTPGDVGCASVAKAPDELGTVLRACSAAAVTPATGAQDGGVVSSLLARLLEIGELDGVVTTRRIDAFRGAPFLATSPEQVRAAAGSLYHQSNPLAILNDELPPGMRRIAFVGTPCQISVLRALQRFPWSRRRSASDAVVLTVALFCTRSFDPDRLAASLAEAGNSSGGVARIHVRDGELRAISDEDEPVFRASVRELEEAALAGCDECADFTGHAADLAVGNLASALGRSTVLVRTPRGLAAMEAASSSLEIQPLASLDPIVRAASRNRARARRFRERGFDPDGPLWISYTEHLAAYSASDRPPAAPPAYRSQHYQVSC